MAVILSAIILLGVYFAVSAAVVAKEVKTAAESVSSLSGMNLTDEGSIVNLDSTVRNLDRHVGIAYANTSNPVWRMMSGMAQYGGNVAAIRTAVDALHDLSHDALPLMVDAMGDVDLTRFSVEESTWQSP